MRTIIFVSILSLALTACDKDVDDIPKITDINSITVDGQPMTAEAFYETYCKLKPTHDTCVAVERAIEMKRRKEATQNRTPPRF